MEYIGALLLLISTFILPTELRYIIYFKVDYNVRVSPIQELSSKLSEFSKSINTSIRLYSFVWPKSMSSTRLKAITTYMLPM